MRIKNIILIVIISFIALAINAQTVVIPRSDVIEMHNGKSYYVHTVQKGQTVYSIAKAYDVSPDEIYFENAGARQGIGINQNLLIPTVNKETELKNEVTKTNFDFFYHVAANNETYDHISSIYLIPKKYIVKANPNLQGPFREGEYIKVPVEEAFDILDGKTTNQVPVTPTPRVNTRRNYSVPPSKPVTTSKTPVDKSKSDPSKNQTTKPTPKIVSFNPNIPVIQDYRHVVILGETTQSIAKKYDIPVEALKAANPGLGNSVMKGDRLRVPDKTKLDTTTTKQPEKKNKPIIQDPVKSVDTTSKISQESKIETIKHKVKKKETLYSIGREYGVTVSELLEANTGLTSAIKIGQVILVPKKKISKPYIIHKAERETKVNKIAKLYRIPVYQIREFNPTLGKRAYKNQEVKIPVGSHAIIVPSLPVDNNTTTDNDIPDDSNNIRDPFERDCNFSPDKNRVFKVALMIPLSLEEADSLNTEQFLLSPQSFFKPFRFIQFYEGSLIALDSLSKQGMKVEMYVYDVDKNLTKTAKVLQQRELRSMDLIIGPFYNNSFNQVALYAGNFNIPIINPLSYREAVRNNYNTVIKVKPGTSSQTPMISTFIDTFEKKSKIFLISQTSYIDADKVIEINNELISRLEPQVKFSNEKLLDLALAVAERDTLFDSSTTPTPPFIFENTEIYPEILENMRTDSTVINNYLTRINYATDSLYPFLENASPLRNNLIILYGTKKSFILDVLNRLNESRDTFDIKLMGLPSWERINNLSNVKMSNLNLSYFSSSYIDYQKESTQDFIHKFRTNYSTEPDVFAFSGFDITYYFLSSLFYLGDEFNNCLEYYPMELIQSIYHFKRIANTNNFEGDYWHMLQLNRLSKSKIPDEIIFTKDHISSHE